MNVEKFRYILVGAVLFIFCVVMGAACQSDSDDDDSGSDSTDNDNTSQALNAQMSGCLSGRKSDCTDCPPTVNETYSLAFSDGALSVEHQNSSRNCAFGPLVVDYQIEEETLTIIEGEPAAGDYVWCGCCFNMSYNIPDLEAREYRIVFMIKSYNGQEFESETLLETSVDFSEQTAYELIAREVQCY